MPLNLEQKKVVVAEVSAVAQNAYAAIAAQYAGLSVGDMTALRSKARASSVYVRVVRNTLARRALQDTDFACMTDGLVGPLVLAFSQDDPGAVARVLGDFARTNDKFVIKVVAFGGKLLPVENLQQLATMPTKDEAISLLMSVMQAPVTKLARTLAEPYAQAVRAVAAIRDQKQAA
jgi:large subunit ribosomal protein L10